MRFAGIHVAADVLVYSTDVDYRRDSLNYFLHKRSAKGRCLCATLARTPVLLLVDPPLDQARR